MADVEGKYFQVPPEGVAVQPVATTRWRKVGVAFVSGCCLALLCTMVRPTRENLDEPSDLFGLSSSLRIPQAAKRLGGWAPAVGRSATRRGDGIVTRAEEMTVKEGEEFEVEQPKPIGVSWSRCADGGIYAKSVNARQANPNIQVGDKLLEVSATFGDEKWPAENYGQTMYAIRTRIGPVYLKILSRGGNTDVFEAVEDETQRQFRMERNGGNYGAGTKEKQMKNYNTVKETAAMREQEFYAALDEFKAGNYEKAVIDFENVRAAEPPNYMGDNFERVTPVYKVASYNIACCYSQLKNQDAAMQALKDALNAGFEDYKKIRTDPNLEDCRKSPKFKKVMDMYDEAVFDTDALQVVKDLLPKGLFR